MSQVSRSTKKKPAKSAKCIAPNCTRKPVSRGLCQTCYMTAKRLVWAGRTTWELLESAGLAKPSKAFTNCFTIAFHQLNGKVAIGAK